MINNIKNLEDLWTYVNELNKQYFPQNKLMPILGGGKTQTPKFMFIFINPTIRNQSSSPAWKGPRFPFIGTKQIWRIFYKAGLFDKELIYYIEKHKTWSLEFTNKLLEFLENKGFYLTNLVKWTGSDAALPDSKKISLFLPILKKEIELVQPEYIITFGLIPFEKLTNRKIKLNEYFSNVIKYRKLEFYEIQINSIKTKIIPCYFPVGRGHPKKAIEILKLVKGL